LSPLVPAVSRFFVPILSRLSQAKKDRSITSPHRCFPTVSKIYRRNCIVMGRPTLQPVPKTPKCVPPAALNQYRNLLRVRSVSQVARAQTTYPTPLQLFAQPKARHSTAFHQPQQANVTPPRLQATSSLPTGPRTQQLLNAPTVPPTTTIRKHLFSTKPSNQQTVKRHSLTSHTHGPPETLAFFFTATALPLPQGTTQTRRQNPKPETPAGSPPVPPHAPA